MFMIIITDSLKFSWFLFFLNLARSISKIANNACAFSVSVDDDWSRRSKHSLTVRCLNSACKQEHFERRTLSTFRTASAVSSSSTRTRSIETHAASLLTFSFFIIKCLSSWSGFVRLSWSLSVPSYAQFVVDRSSSHFIFVIYLCLQRISIFLTLIHLQHCHFNWHRYCNSRSNDRSISVNCTFAT